jgi:hypothetical protein
MFSPAAAVDILATLDGTWLSGAAAAAIDVVNLDVDVDGAHFQQGASS